MEQAEKNELGKRTKKMKSKKWENKAQHLQMQEREAFKEGKFTESEVAQGTHNEN